MFSHAQQLHYIAQFVGIFNIPERDLLNPFYGHIVQSNPAVEGDGGQDGDFAGCVQAAYVCRRIGFCIALFLGFLQDFRKIHMIIGHLRQHIVRGAVDDAHDQMDVVGSQGFL